MFSRKLPQPLGILIPEELAVETLKRGRVSGMRSLLDKQDVDTLTAVVRQASVVHERVVCVSSGHAWPGNVKIVHPLGDIRPRPAGLAVPGTDEKRNRHNIAHKAEIFRKPSIVVLTVLAQRPTGRAQY